MTKFHSNEIHGIPLNPFKGQCHIYVETSQIIYTGNQLTGLYMMATIKPFLVNVHFFVVFKGYQMRPLARNRLMG